MKLHVWLFHHRDKVDGAVTTKDWFHGGQEAKVSATSSAVTEDKHSDSNDEDDDDD